MQQAEAIGQAETELHKHRLAAMVQIRALLTDEQRAELMEIREETRAQWLQPLIDACEADVGQFCPDAKDPWTRKRCLRQRWDEVSLDCQAAVEDARGKGRRGPRERRGPGGKGDV